MNEPIQVDSKRDAEDRLIPLTIYWRDKNYTLIDWGRRWREDEREHMLVRTNGGETFEIAYDEEESGWWLCRQLHPPRSPADVV